MGTIILKIILTIATILIVTVIKGLMYGNEDRPVPVLLIVIAAAFIFGIWKYKPKRKTEDDKHKLNKEQ